MSSGLGIRGVPSAYRSKRLCSTCQHTIGSPSPLRIPPPPHPSRHAYSTGPPGQQVQRYLEQARLSIQAALKTLREHSEKLSASAGSQVAQLGTRLNHVTGYEDIDRLKASVVETGKPYHRIYLTTEQQLTVARESARSLKHAYDTAVTTRASAQRSVNSLLERKDRWSDSDVADFTLLIRSDHASNAAVAQTSAQLNAAEADVDRLFSELTKSILTRYHEEQIWSDKIRSFSSWANLVGLAANLVVFMGAIAFVEPWKRRKLAEGLEVRMAGMMASVQAQIETLADEVGAVNARGGSALPLAPAVFDDPVPPPDNPIPPPAAVPSSIPVDNNLEHSATLLSGYSSYLSSNLTRFYHHLGGADTTSITVDPAYIAGVSGIALGTALTYLLR